MTQKNKRENSKVVFTWEWNRFLLCYVIKSKKIGPVWDIFCCSVRLCQMFSFWICHEPTEKSLRSVHIDFFLIKEMAHLIQWWLTVIWQMKREGFFHSFVFQGCAAATQMYLLTIRDLIADNSCGNLTGVKLDDASILGGGGVGLGHWMKETLPSVKGSVHL